jgi:hypothetical protein
MRRLTTLPEDLAITLTNFADEADAHKTADAVREAEHVVTPLEPESVARPR